jgi:type IV pilus assembly protein PilY1
VGTEAEHNNVVIRNQETTPAPISYCTSESGVACDSNVLGWYWDMPDAGERLTGRVSLINGIALFNTYIPATDASGELDPCAYGGTGWIMGLNVVDGNMADFPVFDLNRDGVIDSADTHLAAGARLGAAIGGTSFSRGVGDTNYGVYAPTDLGTAQTEGKKMSIIINTASKHSGRVSWFELLDELLD